MTTTITLGQLPAVFEKVLTAQIRGRTVVEIGG